MVKNIDFTKSNKNYDYKCDKSISSLVYNKVFIVQLYVKLNKNFQVIILLPCFI